MDADLLNLPWATLLTLAGGYAAYYVANVGIRSHHQTIDVAFSTLVFGFFTAFAFEITKRILGADILWASAGAFSVAIILGGAWSRWGRSGLGYILRRSKVSYNNDLPSAWMELFASGKDVSTFQLAVKLSDGTWLKTDNLAAFEGKPSGPCTFGGNGDLLMYVTHQKSPDELDFVACPEVSDVEWGDEVTYIPQSQIARVDVRRKKV